MILTRSIILLFLLIIATSTYGQKRIDFALHSEGNIQLTTDISIPKINPGYTLWLPDDGKCKGLVVFMHGRRDTTSSEFIINYAIQNNLGVIYLTTENRLEFLFDTEKMQELEIFLNQAISSQNIPRDQLLFCGMSLAGTRALRMAQFSRSEKSKYKITPKAIAICDAPLDMVRFHKEMKKADASGFSAIAANEGRWVSSCLEKSLGGIPESSLSAYKNYSPYCYLKGNDQLNYLNEVHFRAYTEPDVLWWIENRRKDYYGMNALDLAAVVNLLKLKGHSNAELIITADKGYKDDGTRHPHSWNIVNEKELVDWFLQIINS